MNQQIEQNLFELRNLVDRPSYAPFTDEQITMLIYILGSANVLFVGEQHGLPAFGKPGQAVAVRFADEMIIIAAKSGTPIGFIGLEEYVHPSKLMSDRYLPSEKVPFVGKWRKMGIEIIPIDSISSVGTVREREISDKIFAAYQSYGRGIVIIGAHHAIELAKPIRNPLNPHDEPVIKSAFQEIRNDHPELHVASVVTVVKHPNQQIDNQTSSPASPTLVNGENTKFLLVSPDENTNNVQTIGGKADVGIVYPY